MATFLKCTFTVNTRVTRWIKHLVLRQVYPGVIINILLTGYFPGVVFGMLHRVKIGKR
jgi:hypothetical protein